MELCVRFSKNISELNGSGVVLCLLQQVQPDRQPDGRRARQKPWREESHLRAFPCRTGQILAQAFVERPRRCPSGNNPCPRRAPSTPSASICASILRRYSLRAYSGETSSDCVGVLHVDEQHGIAKFRLDLLRVEQVEQDDFVAAIAQRLDGLDDRLRAARRNRRCTTTMPRRCRKF